MIDLSAYLVLLVTLTVAVALPGPGIATLVARTLSNGIRAGFLVTLGTISGDLIWLTVAILGLAAIAKTFAVVFLAIKYVGAAYLMFLAVKLWRAPAAGLEQGGEARGNRTFSSYWLGLSVTLSNPKTIMFYMAILPTLVEINHIGLNLYFLLVATVSIAIGVIFSGYVLLATGIKQAFRQSGAIRMLQRGTGLIMAGAAAMVLTR